MSLFFSLIGFIFLCHTAVQCFGDDCWIIAFGLPAALMLVALVLFTIGSPYYIKNPVQENIFLKLCGAIGTAIGRSCGSGSGTVSHWLDRARPEYTQEFLDDCKAVLRVLALFIPLPLFWALFDQQGSRWTYQAQKMSTYVDFFDIHLEAEQVQIMNGLMIVVFVAFFDAVVYPLLAKCNLLKKPLQRIVAGCILAAVSFLVIGFIQIEVQSVNDDVLRNSPSTWRTRIFNTGSCTFDLTVKVGDADPDDAVTIDKYGTFLLGPGRATNKTYLTFDNIVCGGVKGTKRTHELSDPYPNTEFDVRTISDIYFDGSSQPTQKWAIDSFPWAVDGSGKKKVYNEWLFHIMVTPFTSLPPSKVSRMELIIGNSVKTTFNTSSTDKTPTLVYATLTRPSTNYKVRWYDSNNNAKTIEKKLQLLQGGGYTIFLKEGKDGEIEAEALVDKIENGMSAYWQAIPYFIITAGEIFFSITGLSFAFSQAPASMKSILTAGWLLTASFGRLIFILIPFQT